MDDFMIITSQTSVNEWEVSVKIKDVVTKIATFYDNDMLNLFLKTLGVSKME
jgi:hypothetical protein